MQDQVIYFVKMVNAQNETKLSKIAHKIALKPQKMHKRSHFIRSLALLLQLKCVAVYLKQEEKPIFLDTIYGIQLVGFMLLYILQNGLFSDETSF